VVPFLRFSGESKIAVEHHRIGDGEKLTFGSSVAAHDHDARAAARLLGSVAEFADVIGANGELPGAVGCGGNTGLVNGIKENGRHRQQGADVRLALCHFPEQAVVEAQHR
jgi:hypothetical protein